MGTWEYRVMRRAEFKGRPCEEWFGIYEIHYDDDGAVMGWTDEPIEVCGETFEEVANDLKLMTAALQKSTLDWSGDMVGRKDIAGPRSKRGEAER